MRVVVLAHSAALGGAEIGLLELLRHSRTESLVIFSEDGPALARAAERDVRAVVVPAPDLLSHLSRTSVPVTPVLRAAPRLVRYYRMLRRAVRGFHPDVVAFNSVRSLVLTSAALRVFGPPQVFFLRDALTTDYMGRRQIALTKLAVASCADGVIANSAYTMSTAALRHRGPRTHLTPAVMSSFVDVAPRPTDDRPGAPLKVLLLGRVSPWKGQHVGIEALTRLTDVDVRLTVAGAPQFGEDDYLAALERLTATSGLQHRVSFAGHVSDVLAMIDQHDVVLHTSTSPEPFGQVVLQGMLRARVVVAADAGGPAELVDHGSTGFLYPPGDADALAGLLRVIAEDRPRREAVAHAARSATRAMGPDASARAFDRFLDVMVRSR